EPTAPRSDLAGLPLSITASLPSAGINPSARPHTHFVDAACPTACGEGRFRFQGSTRIPHATSRCRRRTNIGHFRTAGDAFPVYLLIPQTRLGECSMTLGQGRALGMTS